MILRNNKDFLAGWLFVLIGGLAVVIARDYPLGSAMRMGPGYFPAILGGLLCLFGGTLIVRGIRSRRPPRRSAPPLLREEGNVAGGWGWRPLALIALSMVLFGFLLGRLGLIPALAVMFFVSALGGREFRFKEVLILTVLMSAFAAGVFIYGLKLPYPLLGGY